MNSIAVIIGLISVVILIFIVGAPVKTIQILGKVLFRFVVGVLILFIFNVFGGYIGLHLPINLFTVGVSSLLGILGIISLISWKILFL